MTSTAAPDPHAERVLVGRFERYRDVKRAVDTLSVGRIPDKRITVLGRRLRWSPPLTGGRAARLGAWLGAAIGAVSLLVLALLGATGLSWLGAVLAGAVIGGLLGVALGLVVWRVSRDKAMLPESGHVDVGRYELLVEPQDLDKARQLLGD